MKTLLLLAVLALMLGIGSACAPITAYEASHPYYRFPGRGGGGDGTNG